MMSLPPSRRRPAWGWRLVMFVALLLALTLLLQAVVVVVVGVEAVDGLSAWSVGAAVVAGLAVSWVMMSRVESRPPASLGLVPGRRGLLDFVKGCVVGGVLVGGVYVAMAVPGWVEPSDLSPSAPAGPLSIPYLTVVLLLAAFLEELVLRGYPFQVLAEARGPVAAVAVTSLLFGALHGANPGVGWLALGNTILAGILLGVMYWRTLSLWLVTGAHLAWNWTMGVALGLPVSGLDVNGPRGHVRVTGPELWTGGEYGPEGGLLLGLATVIGILWTVRTPHLTRDPGVLALDPLPAGRIHRTTDTGVRAQLAGPTESEAK